jgi:hypothetical protein
MPTGRRDPVDVTITVNPLDGETKTLRTTPDTINLSPNSGAGWLHRIIVEIRSDRVVVAVVPDNPNVAINKMTVRPDGSATFTT